MGTVGSITRVMERAIIMRAYGRMNKIITRVEKLFGGGGGEEETLRSMLMGFSNINDAKGIEGEENAIYDS